MSTFSWIIAAAIANAILSDDDDKSKGEKETMMKKCNHCINNPKRMKSLEKRFEKSKDESQKNETEFDIMNVDFPVLSKEEWLKRVKGSELSPDEVEALCKAQPPQIKDRAKTYKKMTRPICVQGTPTSQVQEDNEDSHSEVVTIDKETLKLLLKDYPYLSENLKEMALFNDGKYKKLKSYLKNLFKEVQEGQKSQEALSNGVKEKTITAEQIQGLESAYDKFKKLIDVYALFLAVHLKEVALFNDNYSKLKLFLKDLSDQDAQKIQEFLSNDDIFTDEQIQEIKSTYDKLQKSSNN